LLFALLDTNMLTSTEVVNTFVARFAMDFKTATDRLSAAKITADDIAEAFGVVRNTIARARLDSSSPAYRSPPENWRPVLARLARERIRQLAEFADEMER
jgi:hypothetical protein